MNVLIACEESQTVCKAFRARGHNAFSCDIIEPSGGHPEWHIQEDVTELINGHCVFVTLDGKLHQELSNKKWDLIIAHPPCTFLTVSGNRWFNVEKYGQKALERYAKREQAIKFFMMFVYADCDHIAIENPVGHISTAYRKPDQIINPWQFGHTQQKKTCLWLRGLPKLQETNNVYDKMMTLPKKERAIIWWMGSGHAKERSKTFEGIADAMAEQWGKENEPWKIII